MNIHEAVQILAENMPRRKWINPDNDALAEATETVVEHFRPAEPELEGGGSTWWHVCGECHGAIDDGDMFCKHCGKPVKKRKSGCDGCTYKGSEDCILGQQGSENAFCPNGKL